MSIETKIEGSQGSITASASYLRDTFGNAVADASTAASKAKSTSDSDWGGDAGNGFRSAMTTQAKSAEDLSDDARSVAGAFDKYGEALGSAKRKMTEVLSTASGAGLDTSGTKILPPGPAPAVPGPAGANETRQQTQGRLAAMQALREYHRKVAAYQTAKEDAEKVRQDLKSAREDLGKAKAGLSKPPPNPFFAFGKSAITTPAGIFGSLTNVMQLVDGALDQRNGKMFELAKKLRKNADEALTNLKDLTPAERIQRRELAKRLRAKADTADRKTNKPRHDSGKHRKGGSLDRRTGGHGAVRKVGKGLGPVGNILSAIGAAEEVQNGASPGKVIAKTAGSAAGGAIGGYIGQSTLGAIPYVGPVTGAIGQVAGSIGGSIAGGWAAEQGWDKLPANWRHTTDNFLLHPGDYFDDAKKEIEERTVKTVTDVYRFGEDAKDSVDKKLDKAGDWIGDRTPW